MLGVRNWFLTLVGNVDTRSGLYPRLHRSLRKEEGSFASLASAQFSTSFIFPCNMMAVEVFNSHIDVFFRYFMGEVKSLSGWFIGRAYREIEFGWFGQHNLP